MARGDRSDDGSQGRRAWWPITVLVVGLLVAAAVLAGAFQPEQPSSMAQGWIPAQVQGADDALMTGVTAVSQGFLAVGHQRDGDRYVPAVWRSKDGHEWTRIDGATFGERAGVEDALLAGTQTGGSLTVAAGWEGSPDRPGPVAVWVSPDEGETWDRVQHVDEVFTEGRINDLITTQDGAWIVAGTGHASDVPEGTVWRSPDGRVWERLVPESAGPGTSFEVLTMGGDGLVALGSDAGRTGSEAPLWTSKDGTSWRQLRMPGRLLAEDGRFRDAIPWRQDGMMVAVEEGPDDASTVAVLSRLDTGLDEGTSWRRTDVAGGGAHVAGLLDTGDGHVLLVGWVIEDDEPRPRAWVTSDGSSWEPLEHSGLEEAEGAARPYGSASNGKNAVIVGAADGSAAAWVHGQPQ